MNKITVIIPVDNKDIDLLKPISSLIHQNYKDFQVIVISNCDIKKLKVDQDIKYIQLKDLKTIPELLNAGLNYVKTEYTCFLHPDDLLLFNAIKLRLDKFLDNPTLKACYGLGIDTDMNYRLKQNQNHEYFFQEDISLPENSIESILASNIQTSITSLMLKTEVMREINFNKEYRLNYFHDFFIKLFQRYPDRTWQLNDALYISRLEEGQIKRYKKSFFTKFMKETLSILDNYFEDTDNLRNLHEVKHKIYRNNYSKFFAILSEYFTFDYCLRIYLLTSYIKKNSELGNKILDFWFFSILLNSVIAAKNTSFSVEKVKN